MLWLERDRASAALHIALLKQDPEVADEIIVGLLNLSHKLLLKLAKEQGGVRQADRRAKPRELPAERLSSARGPLRARWGCRAHPAAASPLRAAGLVA